MRIGYFLSSEEYTPAELIEQARLAEEAGFAALWISDHYHPWTDAQGQSPLVWSMIGAISQVTRLPITTAVTCPTVRVHPAVIAQAAATSAVLTQGRFTLGVGTGEALNEHIFGDAWPNAEVRLEMLEEAVEVMRKLWTGEFVNHRGKHYTVEHARVYTLPDEPPKVYVSAFGPKAMDVAVRIGDGFITTEPATEMVTRFKSEAGADKVAQGGFKACYADSEDDGVKIAKELWPNMAAPGELAQVLFSPKHFESLAPLVTQEQVRQSFACGPDPAKQHETIAKYADAGFDEVYVSSVGPHYRELIDMYRREVLPR